MIAHTSEAVIRDELLIKIRKLLITVGEWHLSSAATANTSGTWRRYIFDSTSGKLRDFTFQEILGH